MTRLSVNINKIATLRNARGGNIPDLLKVAKDCEQFGADGITVHPRPDERHIKYADVRELKKVVTKEFNIEGYPSDSFLELVHEILPTQVTLVPDPPDVITSNAGWDTVSNQKFLRDIIDDLKKSGIRTSIFIEPNLEFIRNAPETNTDRIELYTENYAHMYSKNPDKAIHPYKEAALLAHSLGLEINAGHDLNLSNLSFFKRGLVILHEVSIGHALISDALYYGLENIIQMYKHRLG